MTLTGQGRLLQVRCDELQGNLDLRDCGCTLDGALSVVQGKMLCAAGALR